jgi:hypothetical protein
MTAFKQNKFVAPLCEALLHPVNTEKKQNNHGNISVFEDYYYPENTIQ